MRLVSGVEERVLSVVEQTAVVLGRVGLRLMHGAGLQGCLVGNVLERHEAMSVATAERAEFGFVVGVYVDVDAFADGFHLDSVRIGGLRGGVR